jgi:uncharacterized membrane protein YwaF
MIWRRLQVILRRKFDVPVYILAAAALLFMVILEFIFLFRDLQRAEKDKWKRRGL